MSIMLYKFPAKTRNRVKVGKENEFDIVVVKADEVESCLEDGWFDEPAKALDANEQDESLDANGNGYVSKDEMIAYAEANGIEVKKSWSKAKIEEAIVNAVQE